MPCVRIASCPFLSVSSTKTNCPGAELLAWGMKELAEEAADIVVLLPATKCSYSLSSRGYTEPSLICRPLVLEEDEGKS
jgi:hypothetical protein